MPTIKTFGAVDERSLAQLERCMAAGDAEFGVLCADHHPGYSQPIGGGIAYEGYVSLYSTVHGAGRVMSRSQAAGRIRRQTVHACSIRDCNFAIPVKEYTGQACPEHPTAKMRRWKRAEVLRPGLVNWPAVQARLRKQGIVLLG